MHHDKTNSTVILLLDGKSNQSNEFMKEWLDESPFVTNESTDFFDLLEDLSDFTMGLRPDVVLFEAKSLKNDYFLLRQMMKSYTENDEFPILALSDSGKVVNDKLCFEGNFAEVKAQLTKVFPKTLAAAAAPAV
jgi:DNA-binding response OmpR family regulator